MKLRTTEYFLRESLVSIGRNSWMASASVGTVAVSLFVLGVFLLLVLNMNRAASIVESQVQIAVYLRDDMDIGAIRWVGSEIQKIDGINSIEFVSKDVAIERLRSRLGDQSYLLDALEENPLPNGFNVTMREARLVPATAEKISKIDGVTEAKYGQDVVENLFDITQMIRVFGLCLMLTLAGATIFIISNTIRLTIFARRKEIAIMKYVGATDEFIRLPFVIQGVILGFIGGMISAIALSYFYSVVSEKIFDSLKFFPLLPQDPYMKFIGILIIVFGMIIGAAGSTISLKKFLEV
ncbi:MAG: permease-like cell division protein FtsX [Selenomonadaceae bacterium]|nr:permease-like cell division protein FtsX [Selenomonadaceae bacterium]